MKEISLKLRGLITLLCICLFSTTSLTSCSDDDDEGGGGLAGYWVVQNKLNGGFAELIEWCLDRGRDPYGIGSYYRFNNDNTVSYGDVDAYNSPRQDAFTTVTAKGRTYYLVFKSPRNLWSYQIIGNTIYLNNGPSFIKTGDKLYHGSDYYIKIK